MTGTLKYDWKPRERKCARLWWHHPCAELVGGTQEILATDLGFRPVLSAVASGPQSLLCRDSRHREGVAWLAEPWKYGFNIPSVIFLCGSWDKTVQST